MANMSYCRFRNTVSDLQDCLDNWNEDADLSDDEARARKRLLQVCRDIVEYYGEDEDEESE